MRLPSLVFLSIILMQTAFAHPGVGIVVDSRGNVFYTDLRHVWKIEPGRNKSIVVHNVHTHELFVDSLDNLFGEHLWYEGEATDRWRHYVWRLSVVGTLTTIIPARNGFKDDYNDFHFVRDGVGSMYWVDRGNPTTVRKRTPAGKIVDIAQANFRNVRWLTVSRTGTMYLVDLHDLVRIEPGGEVRTVAKNLADRRRSFLLTTDIHAIMGLWTDPQGNLYAAVFSDKAVKKVSPDGRVGIVFRSDPFWGPTGGVIDRDGSLWILEYSETHSVRVQKIDKEGKITIF